MAEQIPYPQVTPGAAALQGVASAQSWDWLAIVPIMMMMMVFGVVTTIIQRVTEPEFVKEVRPIGEAAVRAKMIPKMLE